MATYGEIRGLFSNIDLKNRVTVALIVAAETIRGESDQTANHANRLKFAQQAFSNPEALAEKILMVLLATNRALTVAQITGASDAGIQSAVDGVVNLFADGT